MKAVHFFYHINLDNKSAGGILNFLRGLIKALECSEEINYYTMAYDKDLEVEIGKTNQVFLKKMTNNPNEKIKVTNSLVYIIALLKFFMSKSFNKDDVLIFNRSDHTIPVSLLRPKGKKILIIHGSSKSDRLYFNNAFIKRMVSRVSEHFAIRNFDQIVVVSQEGYDYYKELYPKLINKFIFIPTFVNREVFQIKDSKIYNKDQEISYIYYGRFVKQKGIYYLKKYFDYLDDNNVSYNATLIGEGELRDIFINQKNVRVLDTLPQDEIVKYLHEKVILIMFSRWEGMPLTLLESLATGTPAICSKAGEMENIIKVGENGFLFDNIEDNYEKILERSKEVMDNYSYYSKNAIQSIEKYTVDQVAIKYMDIIKKLFSS